MGMHHRRGRPCQHVGMGNSCRGEGAVAGDAGWGHVAIVHKKITRETTQSQQKSHQNLKVKTRKSKSEVTGRWPRLDRRVRSVEAAETLASVSDRTLGHLVTGRWRVVSGPADVAAHKGDAE